MRTPMIQLPLLTLQPMIQQRLLQQLLHVTARAMKLLLSEKWRRIQQAAWKSHQQRKQRWMAKSDRCTIFFIEMFWTHEQDIVFTHASKLGILFTSNVRYVPGEAVATYYCFIFYCMQMGEMTIVLNKRRLEVIILFFMALGHIQQSPWFDDDLNTPLTAYCSMVVPDLLTVRSLRPNFFPDVPFPWVKKILWEWNMKCRISCFMCCYLIWNCSTF